MKAVICGAGTIGLSIVENLGDEHEITLIDQDTSVLASAIEKFDVQTIHGNATTPETLFKADTHKADIFIAVTGTDESNILACQMVHSFFPQVTTKIARLRHTYPLPTDQWAAYQEHYLPIDIVINPERETIEAILRYLYAPFAFSHMHLFDQRMRVLGIQMEKNSPFLTCPLKHLDKELGPIDVKIMRVVRQKAVFIPQYNDVLEEGDKIHFLLSSDSVEQFTEFAGLETNVVQRLLILGGRRLSLILAAEVEKLYPSISTVIIMKTCDPHMSSLLNQLHNTIVLNGDPLEPSILEEAGVQFADNIISVTNDDKTNILGALLGKRYGAKSATALVSKPGYMSLMASLGIEQPLNLSSLTLSLILRRMGQKYMRALYRLDHGTPDTLVEVHILPSAPAAGMLVGKINHPRLIYIFSVLRQDNIFSPEPDFKLEAEDRLIILADQAHFRKSEHLFTPVATT